MVPKSTTLTSLPARRSASRPWVFLQGLGTPFLRTLARLLINDGQAVLRVNFCGGDPLFGGGEPSLNYRGAVTDLSQFYAELIKDREPLGFLLFGDERPIHRPLIPLAKAAGIPVLVYEEGYLRPNWITLEHSGANANSMFPRTASEISALAEPLIDPGPGPDLPPPMPERVRNDLKHKAGNILFGGRFPHYQTHRPYPMWREARGWIGRLLRSRSMKREIRRVEMLYAETQPAYFLVPLQLSSDVQIRVHSPFDGMPDFISMVCRSFADHAPQHTRLLIKNHPLDNGVIPYHQMITELSETLGIAGRVDYVSGGDLAAMISGARGVVTVNSTVGLTTLRAGKPLSVHGEAIYKIAGIVHTGDLSDFWDHPVEPAPDLVDAVIKVLKTACMVEGDLFTPEGIAIAARGTADVILGLRPRLSGGPRLAGGSRLAVGPKTDVIQSEGSPS